MTIKTLEGITPEQAMEKTKRIGSAKLRKWIRREALKVLGEGDAFDQLQALLSRCRDLTERRNDVIHGTIGKELDGEPQMRSEDNRWGPLPSTSELDALAEEIRVLLYEINDARLTGFLAHALIERRLGTPPPGKEPARWQESGKTK